jgi:type I restriction enzyme M protein
MVPAEVERKIDSVWDAFWSAGISNPLEVVEQISYLIFLRFLDGAQTRLAGGAAQVGESVGGPVETQLPENLHWSHMVRQSPSRMLAIIRDEAFPWLRAHHDGQPTFFRHLRDARFTIPSPGLLAKVMDLVESIPLAEKAAGVAYEYMLRKIATAGQNGQFLTPRHIVQLMVEMLAPSPADEICDPACGTAGFLVAAADYMSRTHAEALLDTAQTTHFNQSMFHGFDFDRTMLRIASMNMLLNQIENPDIRYRDSLAESVADEAGRYSLVLTNPPFAGSLDYGATAEDLHRVLRTRKTELLFLALILELLKPGGRAAVIVPEGVLFGSTPAHKQLRRLLVENHRLDAVVKLPAGSFRPYAGISTSIVFFTKTSVGSTENVWFYDTTANDTDIDDESNLSSAGDKFGRAARSLYTKTNLAHYDLSDVLARWAHRNNSELRRERQDRSFCVPKTEIAAEGYDLSLSHYRENRRRQLARTEGWRLGDFASVLAGEVSAKEIDRNAPNIPASKELRVLHPSLLVSPLPDIGTLPIRMNSREPKNRLRQGDIVGRDLASNRNWTVLPADYEGVQAGQGTLVIRLTRETIPAEYVAA